MVKFLTSLDQPARPNSPLSDDTDNLLEDQTESFGDQLSSDDGSIQSENTAILLAEADDTADDCISSVIPRTDISMRTSASNPLGFTMKRHLERGGTRGSGDCDPENSIISPESGVQDLDFSASPQCSGSLSQTSRTVSSLSSQISNRSPVHRLLTASDFMADSNGERSLFDLKCTMNNAQQVNSPAL